MSEEINNSQFPKNNPFTVPEGYFETLDKRIEEKVKAGSIPPKQRIIRLVKPIVGLAASFALAFLLIRYPLSLILPDYKADTEITFEDFFKLLTDDIDENTLYQVLTEEDSFIESDEVISLLLCNVSDLELYSQIQQ